MNKKTIILPTLAILGVISIPFSSKAFVSAESQVQPTHQNEVSEATNPQILSVTFVHYNTIHINISPIDSSLATVLLTYTNNGQDIGLGQAIYNEQGQLIGFEIDLKDVANNPVSNKEIADTLKFKVVNNITGEVTEYPISNTELLDIITQAIDYGNIENLGEVTAVTKGENYSLYFGKEIVGDHILNGQITSLTGGLQFTDKQKDNRNLVYRLVDNDGKLVGRISRVPSGSETLLINPTDSEYFTGNKQYHLTVTNYVSGLTEEVLTFTPFNIF